MKKLLSILLLFISVNSFSQCSSALNAILPNQTGNSGKVLKTDGSNTSWINVTGIDSAGTVNYLKSYAKTQDSINLVKAKHYADSVSSGGGGGASIDTCRKIAKAYADTATKINTTNKDLLVNYNFATGSLSDWTVGGSASTYSFSGGKLTISGTGTDRQDFIALNSVISRSSRVRLTGSYRLTNAKSSTTKGIGFGFQSINTTAAGKSSFSVNHEMTISQVASNTLTPKTTQNTTNTNAGTAFIVLPAATGDTIEFEIIRNNLRMTYLFRNKTTKQETQGGFTYSINNTTTSIITAVQNTNPPNVYKPAIYNIGSTSTCEVMSFKMEDLNYKNPDIAFIGDSHMHGIYSTGLVETRYIDFLMNNYYKGKTHAVFAGCSDKSEDVLLGINEMIKIKPKNAIICIGTNDAVQVKGTTVYANNLKAIVDSLTNHGIRVFIMKIYPYNSGDITPYNTKIDSLYPNNTGLNGGKVIHASYWALKSYANTGLSSLGSADGVHTSNAQLILADIIWFGTKDYLKP